MNKLAAAPIALVLAVGLASCGGDDTAKTFAPVTMSMQNMQRLSSLSMAAGGLPVASFGVAGGVGVDVSSIGAFVRHYGGLNGTGPAMLRHALVPSSDAATGGQNFYFDSYLHLWVATRWSDSTFTNTLYLDQSKTQPAGRIVMTTTTGWTEYPQSYTADYSFTAGKLSGAHGAYTCTQTGPLEGSMSYKAAYADSSQVTGMSNWTSSRSRWQSEWDGLGKTGWYKDSGTWNADKSGAYTMKASDGETGTWTFKPDGSGSAHLEGGTAVKLPADLTWTPTGNFKAVFADKTDDEWTWSDVWALSADKAGAPAALISAPASAIAEKVASDAKKDASSTGATPGK